MFFFSFDSGSEIINYMVRYYPRHKIKFYLNYLLESEHATKTFKSWNRNCWKPAVLIRFIWYPTVYITQWYEAPEKVKKGSHNMARKGTVTLVERAHFSFLSFYFIPRVHLKRSILRRRLVWKYWGQRYLSEPWMEAVALRRRRSRVLSMIYLVQKWLLSNMNIF